MIDIDNQTKKSIDFTLLEKIAQSLSSDDIELMITDITAMQIINRETRHIDKPTDVLSFPYEKMPMAPLGSIVICEDIVSSVASELGHSEDEERALLFIHGMLHVMGYDHEVDSGEMREREAAIIKQFGLPESLIIRTEDKDT